MSRVHRLEYEANPALNRMKVAVLVLNGIEEAVREDLEDLRRGMGVGLRGAVGVSDRPCSFEVNGRVDRKR
jgi:hypothetical protein